MVEERSRRRVLRARFGVLSKQERRELRKAERGLVADAYKQEAAERSLIAAQERAAWKSRDYLPKAGEDGAAALWTPRSFVAPTHRADSGILGMTYPFLADPGLGTKGTMVGRNMLGGSAFVYGPFDLYDAGDHLGSEHHREWEGRGGEVHADQGAHIAGCCVRGPVVCAGGREGRVDGSVPFDRGSRVRIGTGDAGAD